MAFAVTAAALIGCGPRSGAKTASRDSGSRTQAIETAAYVGSQTCRQCHAREFDAWQGSHHQRAMQRATPSTVLGTFDASPPAEAAGIPRFFRAHDHYLVHAEADGREADFQIQYTFGVEPLQQYLVELPGGRLQAFGIAWDSRTRAAGGQRWLSLYPNGAPQPGSPLHWTGLDQTWNFQCADCHSTDIQKNYEPQTGQYRTQWSEISVGCEACHGPGSLHAKWAQSSAHGQGPYAHDDGLMLHLGGAAPTGWKIDPGTGNAHRAADPIASTELPVCGRCHARRSQFAPLTNPALGFSSSYRLAMLDSDLYWRDGQIRAEDYEYGSFLESRMNAHRVTCSDCHDPHSQRLRAEGNGLCEGCHLAAKYDAESHHHHPAGTAGAQCIACHMPAATYMRVDVRRDHSFRIPRPAETLLYGVPNACNGCHAGRSTDWAVKAVRHWYGHDPQGFQGFTAAFAADDLGVESAPDLLKSVAEDTGESAIARASAVERLGHWQRDGVAATLIAAAGNADPMIRAEAASSLRGWPAAQIVSALSPLLRDSQPSVRMAAARALAGPAESHLSAAAQRDFESALDEYVRAAEFNSDRPEALSDLAELYVDRGQLRPAEQILRRAMHLDPAFTPAAVNLADVYRLENRDQDAEAVLLQARTVAPRDAGVHNALGLTLIRERRVPEAIAELAAAAESAPEIAYFSYVYAVALHEAGQPDKARQIVERALAIHPQNLQLRELLRTFGADPTRQRPGVRSKGVGAAPTALLNRGGAVLVVFSGAR